MIDDVLEQLTGGNPRRLLDDLARIGSALAKADRARPEVECFLASGQLIPEDIEAATKHRISEALVRHLPRSLKPAA